MNHTCSLFSWSLAATDLFVVECAAQGNDSGRELGACLFELRVHIIGSARFSIQCSWLFLLIEFLLREQSSTAHKQLRSIVDSQIKATMNETDRLKKDVARLAQCCCCDVGSCFSTSLTSQTQAVTTVWCCWPICISGGMCEPVETALKRVNNSWLLNVMASVRLLSRFLGTLKLEMRLHYTSQPTSSLPET